MTLDLQDDFSLLGFHLSCKSCQSCRGQCYGCKSTLLTKNLEEIGKEETEKHLKELLVA